MIIQLQFNQVGLWLQERVPSWTDRILYKVSSIKAELRCYDAISSVKTSDHRPVKALLGLKNLKESQL